MNLFGRKPSKPAAAAAPPPSSGGNGQIASPQQSLMILKQKMENIEKRQQFIEKRINNQVQIAKEKSKAGDKRGALFALKTKKLYEQEVAKLDNSILTLQSQVMAIESASVNMDVVSGMQVGHNALKQMQKQMDVDKIQEIQSEIEETMEDANEINNIIGQPLGGANHYDEDELMNELQEFEANELDSALDKDLEELKSIAAPPKKAPAKKKEIDLDLPSVPTGDLEAIVDDDDKALAELQAQMAL